MKINKLILTFSLTALMSLVAAAKDTPLVVADELFVRWRDAGEARTRIYRSLGAEVVWSSEIVSGLELIRLRDPNKLMEAYDSIRSLKGVIYSEPNFVQQRERIQMPEVDTSSVGNPTQLELFAETNDPRLRDQWALVGANGMKVTEAWGKLPQLPEVRVGIIDTGIDSHHEDLQGKVVGGYDFIEDSGDIKDVGGHGTHVSGIIAAQMNNGIGVAGVAPNTTLLSIRAVPDQGDETDLHVIRSIEYAVQNGAKIVNCSFGKDNASQAVAEAFLAAGEKGVLAVVAAGNSSNNLDTEPMYPAAFHTPNMLVVGALTSQGRRAYFSNYSPTLVDLFAPGASVLSTIPGNRYANYDGTSMASPAAAGVAALIRGLRPELSPYQVRDLMRDTARKIQSLSGYAVSGGTVDAPAAIERASTLSFLE